jgi:hypothetical protein
MRSPLVKCRKRKGFSRKVTSGGRWVKVTRVLRTLEQNFFSWTTNPLLHK